MTDDEDEIEFLRTMPPRPKLLAVPPWHGGSEVPTREAYTDHEFEVALANFSRHKAVKEHNARLLEEHDEQVQAHIRDTARRDSGLRCGS
jgi:hypothetical protein